MPQAFDAQTIAFYASSAAEYLSGRPDGVSRHLIEFMDRLKTGSHVLELGCGGGLDSAALMAAGFEVDPTDGVAEIAAIASEKLGREVRVLRFDELVAHEAYDAVWANATLHHVPRGELPGILARIYKALKPGGLHYANFKSGKPDGRDDRNRLYSYLSLDEMSALYKSAGDWDIISAVEYMGDGRYETKKAPWVAITAQRL